MSRKIKEDFEILKKYIGEYKIEHVNKKDFIELTKPTHKYFFALATLLSEIIHQSDPKSLHPTEQKYLEEVSSNIGEAFFCLLHGAYKPCRMMLRSSIEVFLKFWLYSSDPDILKEKLVYKLFEKSAEDPLLSIDPCRSEYNKTHDYYVSLCKTVHSATENDLSTIGSLAYFPIFNKSNGSECASFLQKLCKCYINMLSVRYKRYYLASHHHNRQIISPLLSKQSKLLILGEQAA